MCTESATIMEVIIFVSMAGKFLPLSWIELQLSDQYCPSTDWVSCRYKETKGLSARRGNE
jgi:hypothetical protein